MELENHHGDETVRAGIDKCASIRDSPNSVEMGKWIRYSSR